jgi:hypothetical protein
MKVGDTQACCINCEPAKVTWRDTKTLVIEPGDARLIIHSRIDGDMRVFFCGDAGVNVGYTVEQHRGGVTVSAPRD